MNALRAILEWLRARVVLEILVALLVGLLAVFVIVGVFDPAWVYCFFGMEMGTEKFRILEFVGVGMGGVLLAIGATIANRRAAAMEETNKGAEDGRRQERLKNAIEHLGHESDSVRMGGAYELFHLARDTEDLRQTVMDILCAHIRRTTGEAEYREKHGSKPPTEIQSLLTLLFVQEHEVFEGCRIDLQASWLNGADLTKAHLQGAVLVEAHLQGTRLLAAQLQGAALDKAQLQGAQLSEADLQEAWPSEARLQGADLSRAHLQGAVLVEAYLQGTWLLAAQLQEADLDEAQLQGANLDEAQLQGATSKSEAKLSFKERICQGINQETDQTLISRLPEGSGAITGAYTKEEAERWIAEYEEAMRGVPKAEG